MLSLLSNYTANGRLYKLCLHHIHPPNPSRGMIELIQPDDIKRRIGKGDMYNYAQWMFHFAYSVCVNGFSLINTPFESTYKISKQPNKQFYRCINKQKITFKRNLRNKLFIAIVFKKIFFHFYEINSTHY